MKRVIQFEDSRRYRKMLKECLECFEVDVVSFEDFESFRRQGYPRADLYVSDRHFPEKANESPNDVSWKHIIQTLGEIYPEIPVLILSSCPPRNVYNYRNVKGVFAKPDVEKDDSYFKQKVEDCLGE